MGLQSEIGASNGFCLVMGSSIWLSGQVVKSLVGVIWIDGGGCIASVLDGSRSEDWLGLLVPR